jgi:glycosyltransferase involved in cell wall biosynthesis
MSASNSITIGLITYNRPSLLKEAVKSILAQKYSNFELLIGNDYPSVPVTFETLEIKKDPRITILNHVKNKGESENMNFLLSLATTEWFTWMADDDAAHPYWLSGLLESVGCANSNISAVYSGYSTGEFINTYSFNKNVKIKPIIIEPSVFIERYTARKIPLIGCYGLMKTRILKKCGGILLLGNSFGPYSDTLIPILLAQYGPIAYVSEPLVFLRVHQGSISSTSSDFDTYTTAEKEFLVHLRIACNQNKVNTDNVIYNMLLWFSDIEFAVLSRNSESSKGKIILSYIAYQLKVNFKQINKSFWLGYIKYMIIFLLSSTQKSLARKIKKHM